MMIADTPALPIAVNRRDKLTLLERLHDAEDDHDEARRRSLSGLIAETLEADKTHWSHVGDAIAALARMIARACAASAACDARPKLGELTARLSKAIDDQFDPAAWRVVDAAARLAAGE